MNVCRLFYLLRRKEQFFRVVFLLLLFLNVFFLLEYFISPLHARRLVVCEQHKRGGAEMTCSQRKDENEHKKWAGTTKKKIAFTPCSHLLLVLLCLRDSNFLIKVRNERDFCLLRLWMNGVNPSRKAQQRSASKKPVPQRSSTWADEQEAAAQMTFSDARVALRMLVSESFHYQRKIAPNCDVAALRAKCREQLESIDRLYLADVPPLAILSSLYNAHLWSTPPPCNCGNEKTTTTEEKQPLTTTI